MLAAVLAEDKGGRRPGRTKLERYEQHQIEAKNTDTRATTAPRKLCRRFVHQLRQLSSKDPDSPGPRVPHYHRDLGSRFIRRRLKKHSQVHRASSTSLGTRSNRKRSRRLERSEQRPEHSPLRGPKSIAAITTKQSYQNRPRTMAIPIPPHLGSARTPPVTLSLQSPRVISCSNPRAPLRVEDFDGHANEFVLASTLSKVTIFNSKNFTLRLRGRLLTSTVEMWKCSNVHLIIEWETTSPTEGVSQLGTLQLDPTLENVSVLYNSQDLVGSVILAPTRNRETSPDFGFRDVSVQVEGEAKVLLADGEGSIHQPQAPFMVISPGSGDHLVQEQWVVRREDGWWTADGLARGERDYPLLAK
ncbi:hypothetical protein T439DRAFT_41401 [Meredithblackwellia eburnea MCA 4105]